MEGRRASLGLVTELLSWTLKCKLSTHCREAGSIGPHAGPLYVENRGEVTCYAVPNFRARGLVRAIPQQ